MSTEPTIVMVGINMDDRDAIFRTLDAESYRIIVAENPNNVQQQVEHERVDMVIGDLQSTSFDALEFLRNWKTRHADTAFVFVTIDRDVTSAVESMKLGASDCLIKPVDPEELRMLVAKLLDARNADGVEHEPGSRGGRRSFNIPPGTSLEDLQRAAVEQALASIMAIERMPPRRWEYPYAHFSATESLGYAAGGNTVSTRAPSLLVVDAFHAITVYALMHTSGVWHLMLDWR